VLFEDQVGNHGSTIHYQLSMLELKEKKVMALHLDQQGGMRDVE